ncbi:hypothetical protein LCGC14_0957820 [marine sediment metagenome]|uniref:Uncharacterized protein n=1 Tax=marine sediment metagenome TaxID=412755 RepID=A0A0F9NK03_9ZZZZ
MSNNSYLDSIKRIQGRIMGNISKNQQSGFVNCCEEFQFIRVFDTINFNNKMNRLGITHLVLDEDYNFTEIFESEIIEPIRYHSNNTFGIIGKSGTGKSELAQLITLISRKANKDFLGRNVEFFLCYTGPELHSTLKLLKKGDILWKDEMPKTEGKGSRLQQQKIENVLHSIRKMENTFIFVDPIGIKIDICDLYLESAGMNLKTRTNRFMLLDENRRYFGHIYMKLHDNEQLRDWYETQKDIFIDNIKNSGGKVIVEEDDEYENREEEHSIENFLRNNYESRTKERDIDLYLRYEEGEGSFEVLAKKYSFSNSSGAFYVYNKIKKFVEINF